MADPTVRDLVPATRVLLVGPSNIGDAILASDVITTVRRAYPAAHLTLVLGERARNLFLDDARIQTLVSTEAYDSLIGRVRLAWALWRYRPQIVVDLRHTLYPMFLAPWRAWRFFLRPPASIPHMRQRYLWMLRAQLPEASHTALPADSCPLWFSEKDAAQIDHLYTRWQFDQRARLVIICPGARSHIKRWSAAGFAQVADRLIKTQRATVVFAGEPAEEPIVEEVLAAMKERAHSAVGLTTIRQLGILMQRAALVITNDSAALHLASAVRVPTVAIFGPTDAHKYGPTAPHQRVVRRALFCAPCETAQCRFTHECMRFIDADEVLSAAASLLASQGRRTPRASRHVTRASTS